VYIYKKIYIYIYAEILLTHIIIGNIKINLSRWWAMLHRVRPNSAVAVPARVTDRQVMPGVHLLDG
jgi:hypothetical protein